MGILDEIGKNASKEIDKFNAKVQQQVQQNKAAAKRQAAPK